VIVRPATVEDLGAITTIYNDVVASSGAIWRDEPTSLDERSVWFHQQGEAGHPVLVAGDEPSPHTTVLGFGSFSSFRPWPGYWPTVEHSIHVGAAHRGRGVGGTLLEALCDQASADGKSVIVAGVDGDNTRSIAFHERHGFHIVGRMPGVGRKFGRPADLVLLQRSLSSES
jgi:L-amino acid N-acyltransferase YncA